MFLLKSVDKRLFHEHFIQRFFFFRMNWPKMSYMYLLKSIQLVRKEQMGYSAVL